MKITLDNVRPSTHSTIKGNFDVLFPDIGMKIKECRLVKNRNGEFFIGWPSYKKDDSWIQTVYMDSEVDGKENAVHADLVDLATKAILDKEREQKAV